MSAKSKNRAMGSKWEENVLLQRWAERAADLRRAKRNGHIFAQISTEMAGKFSSQDVHVKIRNMTEKYREETKKMGPSGGSPSSWKHFMAVHQIIGRTAVNNAEIYGSVSMGCHFREHSVLAETERERQILQIIQVVSDDCLLCDPPVEDIPMENIKPFWTNLPLSPQQNSQGLLPSLNADEAAKNYRRSIQDKAALIDESCSEGSGTDSTDNKDVNSKINRIYCGSDFSSDGCESEQTDLDTLRVKKCKKRYSPNSGRYWCGEVSARSNQDHQREYEEKAMKHVVLKINKNIGVEQSLLPNSPTGGCYLRLEAEWKDQLRHRSISNSTNSISISGVGKSKYK